jgi:acetolactate synthase regulatory subunit
MHFLFRVDHTAVCGTLESVLACARRGGVELSGLHASRATRCIEVRLHVHAGDDALRLFATRLGSLIDVMDLQTVTPQAAVDRLVRA